MALVFHMTLPTAHHQCTTQRRQSSNTMNMLTKATIHCRAQLLRSRIPRRIPKAVKLRRSTSRHAALHIRVSGGYAVVPNPMKRCPLCALWRQLTVVLERSGITYCVYPAHSVHGMLRQPHSRRPNAYCVALENLARAAGISNARYVLSHPDFLATSVLTIRTPSNTIRL